MPITQVMSEILMFLKVLRGLKTLKNISISHITWVVGITLKRYSTLQKARDSGNISLENIQNENPTTKTIKRQLMLVR